MGYMLYNERMLETFLHAKKWLKPGGKMYPSLGNLYVAPFNDEQLYLEQCTKAFFWYDRLQLSDPQSNNNLLLLNIGRIRPFMASICLV